MSEKGSLAQVSGVRLLTVDPELGRDLTEDELEDARRRVVLPQIELEPGPFSIEQLQTADGLRGHIHGFLVTSGTATINVQMSGRRCARLVGTGELVLLDGLESDSIPATWEWRVLTPARLALLDERLLAIGREWPMLLSTILKRAAEQTRHAFLQQAISQLPRVEERLLALFWSIADRQGIVRGDSVWVELSVTHDALAQMIGAQRPTVSLGLTRLSERGLLRAEENGWMIDRASARDFPLTSAGAPSSGGIEV